MAKPPKNWAKIAENQIKVTAAAANKYEAGAIASVRAGENPCHKAAQDEFIEKARTSINAAFEKGRQKKGLLRVTDADYIESIDKNAFAAGVQSPQGKKNIMKFQTIYGPVSEAIEAEIDAMPTATAADRKAKMDANFDKRLETSYKDML